MEKTIKVLDINEADELDAEYWRSRTPSERLDMLQYLREEYYTFKNENRKRFQRVLRIVEQK